MDTVKSFKPQVVGRNKCYRVDIKFTSSEALAEARELVNAMEQAVATDRVTWLGTKRTPDELLPGKMLTRALKIFEHLESMQNPVDEVRKSFEFGKKIEKADPWAPFGVSTLFHMRGGQPTVTPFARQRYGEEAADDALDYIKDIQ